MSPSRRALILPLVLFWVAGLALFAGPVAAATAVFQEKRDSDHDKDHDKRHDHDDDDFTIAITSPLDRATVSTTKIPVTVAWSIEPDGKKEKKRELVGLIALRVDGKDVAFFVNVHRLRSGTFTFENVDLSAAAKAKRAAVLVARAFEIKPHDLEFEDSRPVRVTVEQTSDTIPPQISGLVPANGSFTNQIRPAISATVTDAGGSGVAPASIVLQLDGSAVAPALTVVDANTVQLSFTPPTPLTSGPHTVTVDSKDGAGNAAATLSGTFAIDPMAPVISGLQPASGSFIKVSQPPISATITDAGGSGIDPATVVLRLDGSPVAATLTPPTGGASASVSFTPAVALAPGLHTVTVGAKDRAGNAAATAAASFTIDLAAPVFSGASPSPGGFLSAPNPSIGAILTDTGGSGVNPASLQMIVDGDPVAVSVSIVNANQASETFVPGAALAAGLHTVVVSGQDTAGNPATLTWTFTIDTMLPVISGLVPTAGTFTSVSKPLLSALITDAGGSGVNAASVVLKLDGVAVAATVSPSPDFTTATVTFAPAVALSDGTHGFTVDARDRAGNAALTATTTFVVDTAAPVISSPSPPNGTTVPTGTAVISASWTDSGSGLNPVTAKIAVDGADVTAAALVGPPGFSFPPSPALPSGPHSVSVQIQDRAGNLGTLSWSFIVAGPPSAPLNLVATAGNNQVSLTWSPVAGATSYKVFRALASGAYVFATPLAAGLGGTTYLDGTTVNGTTYFYVVEATNASGDSSPSNEASAMPSGPIPAAPTNLLAAAGNAQVSLTWTGSAGAASYKVFRAQVSNGYDFNSPLAVGVPNPTYLDSTAVNGTTYFYVVKAFAAAGDSGPSNEASATPNSVPSAPVLQSAIGGDGFVSLAWTSVPGAATYMVFRATVSGAYGATPLAQNLAGTSFIDNAVVNGTTYFYVIKATNAAGDSLPSNERFATPGGAPDAPVLQSAVGSDSLVSLTWTSVPGAATYKVFRAPASGAYGTTPLAQGLAGLSFNDTTVVNGTTYFYVVKATNAVGDSGPSNEKSATPNGVPAAPLLQTATGGNGFVSLTWTTVSGAQSYKVFRSTVSGTFPPAPLAQGLPGTSFSDATVTNGTTYFYVVKATNAAGDSSASNEKFATPTAPSGNGPAVPQITTPPKKTNDTTPQIDGTSDASVTITVFFNGGPDGTTTADTTGHWTYHNTTSFKGDANYRVTATASNTQGTSDVSPGVNIQVDATPPDVPTNLQVSARDQAVLLTWSSSSASDTLGYNIYRKGPQDTDFHQINLQVVTGTHYVDSGLTNGSLYQYQVSAVDDTMNEAHP